MWERELANAVVIQAYHDFVHGRLSYQQFYKFVHSEYFVLLTRGAIVADAIIKKGVSERDYVQSGRRNAKRP